MQDEPKAQDAIYINGKRHEPTPNPEFEEDQREALKQESADRDEEE